MPEAKLEQRESGLAPASKGWFVANVGEVQWFTHEAFGSGCRFDSRDADFDQLGINIRVLEPGQPNCLYHRENLQEDFLVLHGECVLLVDGQERPLKAWDFVHLSPETDHVVIGAGDGPCVVLMTGARSENEELFYPVSELAERHGASAEKGTPSPEEAYARFQMPTPTRPASWDSLPWAQRT
jgi:uncharacterized cupin superfamily protein